ncbi:MAG: M23 family metallopeptidase [Butyrivibrio sp.]|nr:M23 family metallopeptidase [Butyrivibrio sp.]
MNFKDTVFKKKIKIWFLESALVVVFAWILCMPSFTKFDKSGKNLFTVKLNDTTVGVVGSEEDAYEAYRKARRAVADSNNELTLAKADLVIEGQSVMVSPVDSPDQVALKMAGVLEASKAESSSALKRSYSVKIKDNTFNLSSSNDVISLLQAALHRYDEEYRFDVKLTVDPTREVNVLTPEVYSKEKHMEQINRADNYLQNSGIIKNMADVFYDAAPVMNNDMDFEDFDYGVKKMEFGDKVEIIECYLPEESVMKLSEAVNVVTKDKDTKKMYEVVANDTLSQIAEKNNISLDDLISMNSNPEEATVVLEDQYSRIRPGDTLIVMVPEPLLSINYSKLIRRTETQPVAVMKQYKKNWYTTQTRVLQKGSDREVDVATLVDYNNDTELGEEIQKTKVLKPGIPQVIEVGMIDPPTYMKPISGGRLSSGFGKRNRPTKGASNNHRGVDWATPSGTSVFASSSGTVTRAGWGSGYGYCVYIKHPDGKETRYGHLSKILVSVGQNVDQSTKIALSGNTGVSTGPHLHFEILVGGTQVDPLPYLN